MKLSKIISRIFADSWATVDGGGKQNQICGSMLAGSSLCSQSPDTLQSREPGTEARIHGKMCSPSTESEHETIHSAPKCSESLFTELCNVIVTNIERSKESGKDYLEKQGLFNNGFSFIIPNARISPYAESYESCATALKMIKTLHFECFAIYDRPQWSGQRTCMLITWKFH